MPANCSTSRRAWRSPSSVTVRRAESIIRRAAAARPRKASNTAWHRVDVASTAGESVVIRSSRTTSRHRPPARGTGFGSPQRREWRIRQHRVHPAVFTRAPRRCKSVVQSDFAVADSPKACEAAGTDGVRLGFSCGVAKLRPVCRRPRPPRPRPRPVARDGSASRVGRRSTWPMPQDGPNRLSLLAIGDTAPAAEATSPAASRASQRAISSAAIWSSRSGNSSSISSSACRARS